MLDLNALPVFVRVAEALSFSDAARQLNMPVSTVSRKIAELELQLGVQLIERSTRRLRLTEIGVEVLYEAQRSVEIGDAIGAMVSNRLAGVRGRISLAAPPSIADSVLVPLLAEFQAQYPDVTVQALVSERKVDLIAEGVDLAFRVGRLADSSLVARPLLNYRHQLVASPAYLERRSAPVHPHELTDHRILAFGRSVTDQRWSLMGGGKTVDIDVHPVLAMNDYAGLAEALCRGLGIGDLPPIVRPDLIARGDLVEVMPDWRFAAQPLSMVRLGNRHVPKPLRLFMDFAATRVQDRFPQLPV